MKVGAFVGICLAVVAASFLVLRSLEDGPVPSAASERVISPPAATPSEDVHLVADSTPAAIDPSIDQTEEPATNEPAANPLVARQHDMAEAMFQSVASGIIQRLTASGLAPTDSEALARTFAADLAGCATTSITAEAERQSISVEELILEMRAAMDFGDLNPSDVSRTEMIARLAEVVDLTSMETSLFPCLTGAMQRAGLSYQLETEAIQSQLGLSP